jgi:hypothetical protein
MERGCSSRYKKERVYSGRDYKKNDCKRRSYSIRRWTEDRWHILRKIKAGWAKGLQW